MTDPKVITLELQAIKGAVTLAVSAIKKVQTQQPPGPPEQPIQDLLAAISSGATEITQIANSLAKNGGSGQ